MSLWLIYISSYASLNIYKIYHDLQTPSANLSSIYSGIILEKAFKFPSSLG